MKRYEKIISAIDTAEAGGYFSVPGAPDIFFTLHGKTLEIRAATTATSILIYYKDLGKIADAINDLLKDVV